MDDDDRSDIQKLVHNNAIHPETVAGGDPCRSSEARWSADEAIAFLEIQGPLAGCGAGEMGG